MRPPRYNESGPFARIWKALNLIWDELRKQKARKGRGIRLHETSDGTTITAIPGSVAVGGTAAKRCKITSTTTIGNTGNYVTATVFNKDGRTLGSESIRVAIPIYMRLSLYNGLTIGGFSYTVVSGQIRCRRDGAPTSAYVVKAFFPPYLVGQEIYAIQPEGKTDVEVQDELLEWMDINNEARRLDTVPMEFQICKLVNGQNVAFHVAIEGGPPY